METRPEQVSHKEQTSRLIRVNSKRWALPAVLLLTGFAALVNNYDSHHRVYTFGDCKVEESLYSINEACYGVLTGENNP